MPGSASRFEVCQILVMKNWGYWPFKTCASLPFFQLGLTLMVPKGETTKVCERRSVSNLPGGAQPMPA